MNKSIATAAIAATLIVAAQVPAQAQMINFKSLDTGTTTSSQMIHKTGKRGRVAAGIALGLLGAVAIASHARANDYDRESRYSRHERRCNKWRRWCRNGEDRACWKYDNRC